MKKTVFEFFRRGLIASGFGPIVLAILYLILHKQAIIETLTVTQVCVGIFSVSLLAFIAGGMNIVYHIEKLSLPMAILIHGAVLYVAYLGTYLLNGWLKQGITPILVFSAVFVFGYLVIWAVIYFVTKKRTARLNEMLNKSRLKEKCV